ncbi:MAG TPA: flippase, partial [Solimonas sp.]|nr:flippase [Solimonas sp.]
ASRSQQEDSGLYREALQLCLWASGLAMLGAMAVDIQDHGRPGVLTLMAPMLVFGTAQLLVPWYQGRQLLRGVAYRQAGASASTLALVALLYLSGAGVESYALAMTLETAWTAWILVRHHPGFRSAGPLSPQLRRSQRRALLAEAWPYLLNDLVYLSMVRIDQILIRHMVDDAAVGFYAIAVRLTELTSLAPTLIATAFAPVLARARERDPAQADLLLQRIYGIALLAGLACSLLLFAIREPAVRLLFGEAFMPSTSVIAIHVWACGLTFLTAIRSQWITVHAAQRGFLFAGFLAASTQLALVAILVPRIGITGAAWAYLWGSLVNLLLGPLLLRGQARQHTLGLVASLDPRRWAAALRWGATVLRNRRQAA